MSIKTYNISREQLTTLYLHQKLSTDAVARIFGCNHVTILNYLKRYNIPRRSKLGNRKAVRISKALLSDLYLNQKLTQKQIAQKFGHSNYGIQRWMKIYRITARNDSVSHTKYPKTDFSGDPIEKAYLIGFRLGDLNVTRIKMLVQARCSTTIENQVNLIEELFYKYGNVHVWKAPRGTFEIVALLNQSFNFLLPKNDRIEDWILRDTDYFLSFMAGYSDAEGSYYLRRPRANIGKVSWGMFEIQTFDKGILSSIYKMLKLLGIEANLSLARHKGHLDKRGIKTNQDCWRITVNKKQSLWNFIKLIEPHHKHASKLQDLQQTKNNLSQRNSLPYCKPIIL